MGFQIVKKLVSVLCKRLNNAPALFQGKTLGVRLGVRFRNRETLCESGFQEIGVRLRPLFH